MSVYRDESGRLGGFFGFYVCMYVSQLRIGVRLTNGVRSGFEIWIRSLLYCNVTTYILKAVCDKTSNRTEVRDAQDRISFS